MLASETTANLEPGKAQSQGEQPQPSPIDVEIGEYYQNTKIDLIIVSVDKAENYIDKFRSSLATRYDWLGAFGIAVTCVATIVAATFTDKYFKAATWAMLFTSFSIMFSIIFVIKLIKFFTCLHKTSTKWLIAKLAGRIAPEHPVKRALKALQTLLKGCFTAKP
jgi:hypothetical protein